jgi:NCAIR mutase (PurE)-related protein
MKNELLNILNEVKEGKLTPERAVEQLSFLYKPIKDKNLVFARLDIARELRCKLQEVVYAEGKTKSQIIKIVKSLATYQNLLITRASTPIYKALKDIFKDKCYYNPLARIIKIIKFQDKKKKELKGYVLVVTGGTADINVAEEAAETANFFGVKVNKLYDVGTAGMHRLIDNLSLLENAYVIIVVAGMEGALASVVSGLVDIPIIAVPTSVGYGASFGGLAALLTMLNCCAPGVSVVNIDNGFAAGYLSYLILSKE